MRFAATQATNAAERFLRQWQEPTPASDEWRNEVEAATEAEFGFPSVETGRAAFSRDRNRFAESTHRADAIRRGRSRICHPRWMGSAAGQGCIGDVPVPSTKDFPEARERISLGGCVSLAIWAAIVLSAPAISRGRAGWYMAHLGPSPCEGSSLVSFTDLLWWTDASHK